MVYMNLIVILYSNCKITFLKSYKWLLCIRWVTSAASNSSHPVNSPSTISCGNVGRLTWILTGVREKLHMSQRGHGGNWDELEDSWLFLWREALGFPFPPVLDALANGLVMSNIMIFQGKEDISVFWGFFFLFIMWN
jgi:hypothetical protein